jgi:hypothetical protein
MGPPLAGLAPVRLPAGVRAALGQVSKTSRSASSTWSAGVGPPAPLEHLVDGEQRAQLPIPYPAHERRARRSVNTLQQVNSPRTAKSPFSSACKTVIHTPFDKIDH